MLIALLGVAVVVAVVGVIAATRSHGSKTPSTALTASKIPARPATPVRGPKVIVQSAAVGPAIAPGFVGMTMEYRNLEELVGSNPAALDPAYLQLLRQLAPGQRRVLRFGGDSTDWTWWPVAHMRKPPGVRYSLTPGWLRVAGALSSQLDAHLILGINLEADNRVVAKAETRALIARLGHKSIDAIEIGNEPELYGTFGWYRSASGLPVPGRPRDYSEADFTHEFSSFARALPPVPLAGPSSGAATWLADLGGFLRDEPRVRVATVHAYPLKHCGTTPVTIAELLSDQSSHGLAVQLAPLVADADAHHVPLRVDEINAVSCGGQRGVSDTFGSALWALDTLFELAKLGVYGVNIQSVPNTINEMLGASLHRGTWKVRVHPEYYGLMMFAQAAPPGSRVLTVTGPVPVGVKVWATHDPDGHVRIVVINKHLRATETVRLRIGPGHGTASVQQLRAPSVGAKTGVTLGGQTFGATTSTGVPEGRSTAGTLAPQDGTYVVHVPGASATMLTVASN